MNVEVLFLPPLATSLPSKLCVVIDVLRATSTLATMLDAGAKRVILAESTAAAPAYADTLLERPLLCGEAGGLPPIGFDYGNSPREFHSGFCQDRDLLFATSNGTRAMRYVSEAPVVITASLLNASAAVRVALREAEERGLDLTFVCSGDNLGTKFAIDDSFCAGYLVTLVQQQGGKRVAVATLPGIDEAMIGQRSSEGADIFMEESALAAVRMYRSYLAEFGVDDWDSPPPREVTLRAFWESQNGQRLAKVGLAEDMEYCAQIDITDRVPRLAVEGEMLILS